MMAVQQGRDHSIYAPAQTHKIHLQKSILGWPLELDGCLGNKHRTLRSAPATVEMRSRMGSDPQVSGGAVRLPRLEAEPATAPEPPKVEKVEITPPLHERWAAAATAEPAARMVDASAALDPVVSIATRFRAVVEMPMGRRRPGSGAACASLAPEPAEVFVRTAAALTPVETAPAIRKIAALEVGAWTKTLPLAGAAGSLAAALAEPKPAARQNAAAELEIEDWATRKTLHLAPPAASRTAEPSAEIVFPEWTKALPLAAAAASPAPEAVAVLVLPAAVLTPVEFPAGACLAPAFANSFELPVWDGAGAAEAPPPQPLERFLTLASGLTPAVCADHQPRLRMPEIAAEIEPLPVLDEPLVIPAACLRPAAGPAAEPVCRLVYPSQTSHVESELPLMLPVLGLEPSLPYIPRVTAAKPVAKAEPVMSGVQPRIASLLVTPISVKALLTLPGIPSLTQELLALAAPAQSPAAEPAETLVIAAEVTTPAPLTAGYRVPDAAAIALVHPEASPALAGRAASLEPQPVESLMVASSADTIAMQPRLQALEFRIQASGDLMAPTFEAERMAAKASHPAPASPKLVALRPMSTITVKAPQQQHEKFLPSLPAPGMLAVEFHTQRVRGTVYEKPEWKTSRIPPAPPKFAVRPVFGKLEEPAVMPKPVKQEPEFVKTFSNPAKRPSRGVLVAGQIAAGILLASSLWYAYSMRGHIRTGTEVASALQSMPSSGGGVSTLGFPGAAAAAPSSGGPLAWMRQTLAKRASVEVTDHFRDGMAGWGSKDMPAAPAWLHHPDGYIVPSSLAFFRPSMNFKDYRFEFFGQIESKGMSWSVRSKDANNYHAMKVAVMEAGLRPFVALVHWDVIDGKAGKQSRTPLNIMVHNNRPMQVAVEVDGNRLVTSIDGEEVDTLTYTTLTRGGVGFFAEANERAHLYWMKVSKNDDWLGHVCGFLAGDEAARTTARIWGPQFPGDSRAPGLPGEDSTTLAAVWAGVPYLRQVKTSKKTRRTQAWNT